MVDVDNEKKPDTELATGAYPKANNWFQLENIVAIFVVVACIIFIFVQLSPELIFRNTTATGGDTAAHVWWPAYLRDHLLPWRLSGWSPDFYGGFPAGQFYFPVPALTIVGLDLVLPYNIAFKFGTVLGALLLPIGAFSFAKGLRFINPTPAIFALGATAFLFFVGDTGSTTLAESISFNQHIAGGSLPSLLAGEYSYTLALACALGFMGAFAHALRTGRLMALAAFLFALTVMSHLIVAIFAVSGAIVIWLAFRPIKWFGRAAAIGVVGLLLTAVWTVPLASVIKYTTDMRYTPVTEYTDYLFPNYLFGFTGFWPWEWGAALLIGAALVGGVLGRRRSTAALVSLTALMGLFFVVWEDIQATTVWNLRFLPFWYLGLYLLMALGAAEVIIGITALVRARTIPLIKANPEKALSLSRLTVAVAVVLVALLTVGTLIGLDQNKSFIPYWARWNYRGVEDTVGDGTTPKKQYEEYQSFIDAVKVLPPGRLLWEGNSQLNVYGSPLELMLLPYWTDGKISSMEGVYFEASGTTPYHFMATAAIDAPGNSSGAVRGVPYRTQTEFSLGVRWLQVLGIRYLAVHADSTKAAANSDERLRLVATSPDFDGAEPRGWSVYQVADSELVSPLSAQPVVVDEPSPAETKKCKKRLEASGLDKRDLTVHEWTDCVGVPWFDDPTALDRPLVANGPQNWQHAGPDRARQLPNKSLPLVKVSHIKAGDDSISFTVDRIGVPVMVKVSWFPNWEVEGGEGPLRATPNYMVVTPTQKRVTLRFGTTNAEWAGRAGTLLGIAGLFSLWWWPRRRRRNVEE